MIFKNFWHKLIKKLPASLLEIFIWVTAIATPFMTVRQILIMAGGFWLSAAFLASHKFRGWTLYKWAVFFTIFWVALLGLFSALNLASFRPAIYLTAWLGGGLNLMLAKTPLELALPVGRVLSPLIGRHKAQKLVLAIALVARLIPQLSTLAVELKKTIDRRASDSSFTAKAALWGRAIIRKTLSSNEELSKALLKRWPW